MEHNDIAGFWIRLLAHICDQLSSLIVVIPFALLSLTVDGPAYDAVTIAGGLAAAWLIAKWTAERGGSPLRARLGVLVIDERDGSFLDMNRSLQRAMFPAVLAIAAQYLSISSSSPSSTTCRASSTRAGRPGTTASRSPWW